MTPSNKFNSVAVAVTATSSFTLGLVSVLLVNVSVPVLVAKPDDELNFAATSSPSIKSWFTNVLGK